MKRFATIVALVLLIIAVLICAVACGDNDFPKEYIVTIHQGEGLADIEWNVNDELPTLFKEGYYVEGYYFDKDFTSEASLATLKVTGITKNVDVYVKWQKNACTHNVVTDHAVLPTCTTTGLTEGSHCSICNEVFIAQQEIAALGHDYSSEWTIDVAATCTTDGSKSHHCTITIRDIPEILVIDYSTRINRQFVSLFFKNSTFLVCTSLYEKVRFSPVSNSTVKIEGNSAVTLPWQREDLPRPPLILMSTGMPTIFWTRAFASPMDCPISLIAGLLPIL